MVQRTYASAEEWEVRVEAWRVSGQSKTEWCRAQDVSYKRFLYWEKKLRGIEPGQAGAENPDATLAKAPRFIAVMPKKEEAARLFVHMDQGRLSIEVSEGYSPRLLSSLVETLRPLC